MNHQVCGQFDSKGHCKNPAELTKVGQMPLDFCAKHNHMDKTGIPLKCSRCGDR